MKIKTALPDLRHLLCKYRINTPWTIKQFIFPHSFESSLRDIDEEGSEMKEKTGFCIFLYVCFLLLFVLGIFLAERTGFLSYILLFLRIFSPTNFFTMTSHSKIHGSKNKHIQNGLLLPPRVIKSSHCNGLVKNSRFVPFSEFSSIPENMKLKKTLLRLVCAIQERFLKREEIYF